MVSLLPFFYHEVFVGCRVDGWGFGEEGSSAVPGCRRIFWGQVGVGSLGRRGGGVRQGWLLDSTNSLSSSGRTRVEGGRPLPSPVACETLGRLVSGCWPSSTRSSTAGRWRWHRRRGRTCPHSVPPGTRRTSGRPRRTAWPPPGKKKKKSKQNRILGYHIQKTQIEVAYAQIHKKFTSCSSKQSLKQRAQ